MSRRVASLAEIVRARSLAIALATSGVWGVSFAVAQEPTVPEDEGATEPTAPPEVTDPVEPTAPLGATNPAEPTEPSDPVADPSADPSASMDDIEGFSLEQLLELEIRVSAASLFEESSFDAASTVDLVTREDWERRGARRTLDAIENQPSTMIYPSIWGGTGVAVRGYGSASSVRGIALTLDDVPMNDLVFSSALAFASNVELPVLERIEIVRGPGSAMHGTDAFHGVLSYRSSAPAVDRRVVGGELGTDLYQRAFVTTSHGVGESVRVDASFSYSGLPDQARGYAYTDPSTGAPATGRRALAFRSLHGTAAIRYAPASSPFDASASFHANVGRASGAVGYGRTFEGRSLLRDRDVSGSNTEIYLARVETGVDLPHRLRLAALGYYWFGDVATRSPTIVPTATGPIPSESEVSFEQARSGVRLTLRQPTNSADTRWLVGYEYSRLTLYDGGFQAITDPRNDLTFRSASFVGDSYLRAIHSVLLSAETRLARDVVRIHYGGRVDHYSDFGFQATPRLGLVVVPVESLALKALYGRAFRAPSLFESRGDGADIGGNGRLRAEEIDTFELAAVHERGGFRVQATGFASIWHSAIILVPVTDPSVTSRFANAGRNHAFGGEVSAVYAKGPFRVDASASVTRSRNDSEDVAFRAFPSFIGNLGVGYELARARLAFYVFQRIATGMSLGDPVSNPAVRDQSTLRPFHRLDVNVRWEAIEGRLSIFATVRNVFDRRNAVPSLTNAEHGSPTMPVNASIGLSATL